MAEVSYVQDFFVLRGNPDLCKKYQVDSALSAMVSRLPPPKETHSKERPAGSPSPGEAPQEDTSPPSLSQSLGTPPLYSADPVPAGTTHSGTHCKGDGLSLCVIAF